MRHISATLTTLRDRRRPTEGRPDDLRRRRRSGAAAVAAALLVVLLVTVDGTSAAFSATTSNSGNHIAAGSVTVGDDAAGGGPMFDLANLQPGVTTTRCINVTYNGSLTADVRSYVDLSGDLGPFLTTTVEIGSGAPGGPTFDCTGFAPGSTLFTGTLAALSTAHSGYATGLGGFSPVTAGATRSYRVGVTLADDNAAQAKTAAATWWWEARPT